MFRASPVSEKHTQPGVLQCNTDYIVIEARDIRTDDQLYPTAVHTHNMLSAVDYLTLKEIVIVPDKKPRAISNSRLDIAHRYLLVYERC